MVLKILMGVTQHDMTLNCVFPDGYNIGVGTSGARGAITSAFFLPSDFDSLLPSRLRAGG